MDWDNPERTVIRVTFEGVWGADDIYRLINKGVSMLESVDHPVDYIFDLSLSTFSPRNLLTTANAMEKAHHKNHRLVIVVNANVYIRSILKVGKVFAPKILADLHFVNSVDQAYDIIHKHVNTMIS